jgi:hypothetical protein
MTTGIRPPVTPAPLSYSGGAAVTPHDTNELPIYAKALYVGVAGDVKLTTVDGSTATFKAPVGVLPVTAKVVFSTGSTATNIIALW